MKKDWDGTLKAMKGYGYSYIDLNQVSPYTDRPAADLKASFASHGFTFSNALWSYQAFANEFEKTIADSLILGLSTIVCSPRPRLRTSDDWKSFADESKYGSAQELQKSIWLSQSRDRIRQDSPVRCRGKYS
jgi:sugar phosphate isomerase/epimerase